MRVAILTRDLPPAICGIGDHSLLFGDALRERGVEIEWIAGSGAPAPNRHVVEHFWDANRHASLLQRLDALQPDRVILQYTPLMYAHRHGRQNFGLGRMWAASGERRPGDLFIHESYFRDWRHPATLLRAPLEKWLLRDLARASTQVFTASPPLVEEVRGWSPGKGVKLPLGTNVPAAGIDRAFTRESGRIAREELVLTLFGGGNATRWFREYVEAADALAREARLPIRWLLLGGLRRDDFALSAPVLEPGRVTAAALSGFLAATDVLLIPHYDGVSSKRGTLVAALAHGLPVVATAGPATDTDCRTLPGLVLTPIPGPGEFAQAVRRVCEDAALRASLGSANKAHFDAHLRWDSIAARYIDAVRIPA